MKYYLTFKKLHRENIPKIAYLYRVKYLTVVSEKLLSSEKNFESDLKLYVYHIKFSSH